MTAKKAKAKAVAAGQLAPFDVSRHLEGEVAIAECLRKAGSDLQTTPAARCAELL